MALEFKVFQSYAPLGNKSTESVEILSETDILNVD